MHDLFERNRIKALLAAAADALDGDWLLVGGALVALVVDDRRVTEDLDLVPVPGTPADRLALLDFAFREGLAPEAMNSAADYFVYRTPGWERDIGVLQVGTRGRILQPGTTLFVLLKMGRLSDRDLADCVAMLARADAGGLMIDRVRLLETLDSQTPSSDRELDARRRALRAAIMGNESPA